MASSNKDCDEAQPGCGDGGYISNGCPASTQHRLVVCRHAQRQEGRCDDAEDGHGGGQPFGDLERRVSSRVEPGGEDQTNPGGYQGDDNGQCADVSDPA